jgi:hypothetical protein
MNVREGTRRLAVFFGILGCIVGVFLSFLFFNQFREEMKNYGNYGKLASSKTIQAEQRALKNPSATKAQSMSSIREDWNNMSQEEQEKFIRSLSAEERIQFAADMGWNDGIKSVEYDKDFGIVSILTMKGETVYPAERPSRWMAVLIVALPVFGYFIPWGVVRAIGWVGVGFVTSKG